MGCRTWRWLPVTVVAACGGATATAPTAPTPSAPPVGPNAVVERVIDGDTVDVVVGSDEERVRLVGIDTPETDVANTPAECFGPEATAYTESLLPEGTPVRLERDVVGRDDYGRLLAYVYRTSDGIFVNYEIVRHGFARPLTIPPNVAHTDLFVEAARSAERADAGLWSRCGS